MIDWLLRSWYARLRRIDVEILWPTCKEQARDENVIEHFSKELGEGDHVDVDPLDIARAAFAVHAFRDRAWLVLGRDEIARQIDALT